MPWSTPGTHRAVSIRVEAPLFIYRKYVDPVAPQVRAQNPLSTRIENHHMRMRVVLLSGERSASCHLHNAADTFQPAITGDRQQVVSTAAVHRHRHTVSIRSNSEMPRH